ncbi:hypothetical protein AVEN_99274-1 [Araneus ventricosus]|uniref:Uncharacterized protein n=1 Tax=Araneus ventricosus TaxID=182803 RepID=A0A4Y2KCQ9_ARAVE|nr:hypothetical protein AVEN_99274-1 [Araneus ventricosus]
MQRKHFQEGNRVSVAVIKSSSWMTDGHTQCGESSSGSLTKGKPLQERLFDWCQQQSPSWLLLQEDAKDLLTHRIDRKIFGVVQPHPGGKCCQKATTTDPYHLIPVLP